LTERSSERRFEPEHVAGIPVEPRAPRSTRLPAPKPAPSRATGSTIP